jgi:hypothetical protein
MQVGPRASRPQSYDLKGGRAARGPMTNLCALCGELILIFGQRLRRLGAVIEPVIAHDGGDA